MKLISEDGKMRLTDVATTQQLFRLIQSIPSPKAEPFKLWMAQVAIQRLGGEIARNVRMELEAKTGKSVISPLNAKEGLLLSKRDEENQ